MGVHGGYSEYLDSPDCHKNEVLSTDQAVDELTIDEGVREQHCSGLYTTVLKHERSRE